LASTCQTNETLCKPSHILGSSALRQRTSQADIYGIQQRRRRKQTQTG